jgi:hypothetical protein
MVEGIFMFRGNSLTVESWNKATQGLAQATCISNFETC